MDKILVHISSSQRLPKLNKNLLKLKKEGGTLLWRSSNAISDHLNLGGGALCNIILYTCLLKKISVNHRKGDGQVPHLGKCTSYKLSHRGKKSYKT